MTMLSTAFAVPNQITIGDPGIGLGRISDLGFLVSAAIGTVFLLSGMLVFIMLVWGGFKFIISGGDPKATGQARSIMLYAILGVFLVVIAYFLLALIHNVTGVDVTCVKFLNATC